MANDGFALLKASHMFLDKRGKDLSLQTPSVESERRNEQSIEHEEGDAEGGRKKRRRRKRDAEGRSDDATSESIREPSERKKRGKKSGRRKRRNVD